MLQQDTLVLNKYTGNEALWVNNKDGHQLLFVVEIILNLVSHLSTLYSDRTGNQSLKPG